MTNKEFQNIIDSMKETSLLPVDILKKLTTKDIKRLSNVFGSKTTGKKADLIHALHEALEDSENNVLIHIDETKTTFEPKEIQDYIASSGMHILLAMVVIKSIATKGFNPVTGKIINDCWSSCFQLYLKHYKETIFDDLCNDVYICLHTMAKYHEISVQDGYIVFYPVMTLQGETISNITKVFKALRSGLSKYKNTDSQRGKVGYFTISYDIDGNEILVGETSTQYITKTAECAELSDCLHKRYLQDFIKHLYEAFPKQYETMVQVLMCRMDGFTEIETAEKVGVSRRTIQRYEVMYKEEYRSWKETQPAPKNIDKRFSHETYRKSDVTCAGSYQFKYGDIPVYKESGRKAHGFCFTDNLAKNKNYDKAKKALANSRKEYTGNNVQIEKTKSGIWTIIDGEKKHFVPYAK